MALGSYLGSLNSAQRLAVEHGVAGRGAKAGGPLLVIAGAGSGKTNTLAHRVAHLIVNVAAIWVNWKIPHTNEWMRTFCIITTAANELVGEIHDCMPVILPPEAYDRWLANIEPTRAICWCPFRPS